MSSFLDKAKEKAQQLAGQVKDKVDDVQDRRKADDLLDDLGRIVYRQRTAEVEPGDEARIAELVAELQALEASGTAILDVKGERATEAPLPPPAPSSTLPPPTV
ncbi:MAG: hypothetical protein Q8M22_02460 [Actinomycetota bacterium]|nr:hypothetical protein [Actinomycetota bacterium]